MNVQELIDELQKITNKDTEILVRINHISLFLISDTLERNYITSKLKIEIEKINNNEKIIITL